MRGFWASSGPCGAHPGHRHRRLALRSLGEVGSPPCPSDPPPRAALVPLGPASPWDHLTSLPAVGILANMKAVRMVHARVIYSESAFADLRLWQVPKSVPGSGHRYKYRLATVVDGQCVLRYDNEAGKGDHRHLEQQQFDYVFTTPEQLVMDFRRDIERWNRENSHT